MTIVYILLLVMGIFLYIHYFLFRGELAHLFVRGWRELMHIGSKEATPPTVSSAAAPVLAEGLVVCKEYVEGMERQAGEPGPKNEPTHERITTFTTAKEASAQPEVLEWRDPTYFSDLPPDKPLKTATDIVSKPMQWEDENFAGHPPTDGIAEADLSFQTEQIEREVAASLDWKIEEVRIEMEMSAEEASDVEAFDVDAFL